MSIKLVQIQSVVLMFLYVERDVNFIAIMFRSWKLKNIIEKCKKSGEKMLCSQECMG